jgi:Nuclease-related domain
MKISPGIMICVGWVVASIWIIRWRLNRMLAEEKRRSKSPFKEKLLRPAGESLRLRIEEIHSDLLECGMALSLVVAVTGILLFAFQTRDLVLNIGIWTGLAIAGCFVGGFLWKKLRKFRENLRNYRLGFDGERYVAEKLGEIVPQGYRIFHDFVFDMKPGGEATNFNIDHIVIGPAGVFAVETKTFRQPNSELAKGDKSHEVKVNNDWMIFPGGYKTKKPMDQARRNAQDLSKWLSGSSLEAVSVTPVVAMPGWYVIEERTGDVRVFTASGLPKMIPHLGSGRQLSEEKVSQISDRIEAHCRNVEGA